MSFRRLNTTNVIAEAKKDGRTRDASVIGEGYNWSGGGKQKRETIKFEGRVPDEACLSTAGTELYLRKSFSSIRS
ncbi:hypothetical protein C5167_047469 [Papaver somniferum]|uniref:Uncharacterized protein n=1 Tax=Papaver somniferum TaxID=3469 RepID=A0A4Y7LGR4_PAPSO|nr:hypothetical protein C5167_047469 [Papaver somniferum]